MAFCAKQASLRGYSSHDSLELLILFVFAICDGLGTKIIHSSTIHYAFHRRLDLPCLHLGTALPRMSDSVWLKSGVQQFNQLRTYLVILAFVFESEAMSPLPSTDIHV